MSSDEPTPNGRQRKQPKPLSKLDRMIQGVQAGERDLGREDDPAKEKWPTLWEWLTKSDCGLNSNGDRIIKTPAKLSLTAGPDGWIGQVTDPDLAMSLDAGSTSLEGVFQALEDALTGPISNIRAWGKKQPTLRKRKSNLG